VCRWQGIVQCFYVSGQSTFRSLANNTSQSHSKLRAHTDTTPYLTTTVNLHPTLSVSVQRNRTCVLSSFLLTGVGVSVRWGVRTSLHPIFAHLQVDAVPAEHTPVCYTNTPSEKETSASSVSYLSRQVFRTYNHDDWSHYPRTTSSAYSLLCW
jgi:hypothetical protein